MVGEGVGVVGEGVGVKWDRWSEAGGVKDNVRGRDLLGGEVGKRGMIGEGERKGRQRDGMRVR